MKSNELKAATAVIHSLFALVVTSFGQMTTEPEFEVEVIRNVVYGTGLVTKDAKQETRDLWMDVYHPVGAKGSRPAVIYTHGGSFHIGSPRTAYKVSGAQTTSPEEYCRLFAGMGFTCFAIQYRLGPEEPVATGKGYSEDHIERESIALMMDRVAVIRSNLGLRALDESIPKDLNLLSDTVLAAAEDLNAALQFVIVNADQYKVDKDRIVLGGFSAGAVTSLNVAHGMGAPVAGTFMLSTAPICFRITDLVTKQSNSAPALVFLGQHDLSGALAATPVLVNHYKNVGLDFEFAWVPAFGHFYPSGATSMGTDASLLSVEERIVRFVKRVTATK